MNIHFTPKNGGWSTKILITSEQKVISTSNETNVLNKRTRNVITKFGSSPLSIFRVVDVHTDERMDGLADGYGQIDSTRHADYFNIYIVGSTTPPFGYYIH